MIARRWHGRVPAVKAEEYLRLMEQVGLPDYRSSAGNCGAWCLHRREGDVLHVEMFTFWNDLEAIRGFAGDVLELEARPGRVALPEAGDVDGDDPAARGRERPRDVPPDQAAGRDAVQQDERIAVAVLVAAQCHVRCTPVQRLRIGA